MIEHGCVVDKLHGVIPAQPAKIFQKFMEKVSEERRKGDTDPKYAIIAEMWKLVGNSAFGRTGINKSKHKNVSFCDEKHFNKKKHMYFYYDSDEYNGKYIVSMKKKKVKQNMPIQVACSIYDDSKLRMLQFYYDCIDKYIDRKDFQYIEMDTDSAYMALSDDFEKLIKPELKEEFIKERDMWFPRTDSQEHKAFDKRKPGLFKIEFEGDAMVALCPKMYYVRGLKGKDKFSSKGIQHKQNKEVISFEEYKRVLFSGEKTVCSNIGFRFIDKNIVTYEVSKSGLTPIYDKRVTLETGVHTHPLDI